MASVLYIRKYYSHFLLREEDGIPSSGTSPSVFNTPLIFTALLHKGVITPYVTWRPCDAVQKNLRYWYMMFVNVQCDAVLCDIRG
jgi:hypothetical protein